MLKTTNQRIYAIIILTMFFIALVIGAISFNGLSYNTKLNTKDIATASDLVLDNYVASEYEVLYPSSSKSIIIRNEWNEWLENINTWATSVTEVEDDLYVFTFDTANDAYLAMMRVYGESDYCFETVFDVSDGLNDVDTEVFDTIVSNESGITMKPVTIAVLDTGYSGDSDKVLKGFSLIEGSSNIKDNNGHGTRLIDIIDSMTYDNVKILPIKVANKDGFATILSVYSGIKLAIEQGIDVINISLNANSSERSFLLEEAINEATNKGITVVVSAGNKSSDIANIVPANIDKALVVSAVNIHDTFEYYSNYGTTIDYATYGNYHGIGGTSIAAARMSAMVAYKLGLGEDVSVLREIAYNPTGATWDEYYGYGIVNPVNVYGNELATNAMNSVKAEAETTWVGKTDYDIGPDIVNLDWKALDTETLDKYLIETHYAFVGSLLATLSDEEMVELVAKSEVAKGTVEEVELTYETNVPEADAEFTNKRNVDFVTYCLEEYHGHKEDLVISSDYWWYNNTGTLWLKDNSGETCFRLYAPAKYYVSPDNKITAMWGGPSLNSTDTSDGYMKISKVERADGIDGPSIASAKIIQSGYSNYISIATKQNSITGNLETVVSKNPMGAAQGVDDGKVSTSWQFTFSNYDVGDAEEGQHFTTHLYGEYDTNVRPYGYWDQSESYWVANPTAKPSGKAHTNSECSEANANADDQEWKELIALQKWNNSLCQAYVYINKDSSYRTTIQSVRQQGYNTTENETLDVFHYWYFDGHAKYDPEVVAGSPLATYKGETYKTKAKVQMLYPNAQFEQINSIAGFAQGDEIRYLPKFSSSDYPDIVKMLDLSKITTEWTYKCAFKRDAGITTPDNTNQFVTENTANFVNDNIAVRGLMSSYNPTEKTVQITGLHQAWGFSEHDYGNEGGTNPWKVTETDIPELFIQQEVNKLTIQYSVALEDIDSQSQVIQERWNTVTKSLTFDSQDIRYGETFTPKTYKPSFAQFKDTGRLQLTYILDGEKEEDFTALGYTDVKKVADIILRRPNESGGTLFVTRIYKPRMSTLVVNPAPGRWEHGCEPNGHETEIYSSDHVFVFDNLISSSSSEVSEIIKAPQLNRNNYIATFYYSPFEDNTDVFASKETDLEWDQVKGWQLSTGTRSGEITNGNPCGELIGLADGAGTNYMSNYPLRSDNFFLHYDGTYGGSYNNVGGNINDDPDGENMYYTAMARETDWIPAGYYNLAFRTGGEPASIITLDSGEVRKYGGGTGALSDRAPLQTFSTKWKINSTVARWYSFRSLYKTLDKNGCAPYDEAGNLFQNVIEVIPEDYLYKFGTEEGYVDVLTPAWNGTTLITLPGDPGSMPSDKWKFEGWVIEETDKNLLTSQLQRIYEADEIIDLDVIGNVKFRPYYSPKGNPVVHEYYTITLKLDEKDKNLATNKSSFPKYLYCTSVSDKFYTKKTTLSDGVELSNPVSIVPIIPKYTGKSFVAFLTDDGDAATNSSGNILRETSSIHNDETWTAYATESKYVITLDKNGKTQDQFSDDMIIEYYNMYFTKADGLTPTTTILCPSVGGYSFLGYYETKYSVFEEDDDTSSLTPIIDSSGNILVKPNYFTKDTTLYAAWKKMFYKDGFGLFLDYNYDNKPQEVAEGFKLVYNETSSSLKVFNLTPVRPGYKFKGWYDERENGNLVYNPATGNFVKGCKYWDTYGRYKHSGNMILYAYWEKIEYTVSYKPGILNNVVPSDMTYDSYHDYDVAKNLNENNYKLSYVIDYDTNEGPGSTTVSIAKRSDTINGTFLNWLGDVKNSNKLDLNKHAGLFRTNGVVDKEKVITVIENEAGTLLTVSSSNDNVTTSLVGNDLTITSVKEGPSIITVTSSSDDRYSETDVHYYAMGENSDEPETYSVTLDANGGVCDKDAISVFYNYAYGYRETLPIPTRDGYDFIGWYTDPVSGDLIEDTTRVTSKKPHTLFARWQSQSVTVSFDLMGGTYKTILATGNVASAGVYYWQNTTGSDLKVTANVFIDSQYPGIPAFYWGTNTTNSTGGALQRLPDIRSAYRGQLLEDFVIKKNDWLVAWTGTNVTAKIVLMTDAGFDASLDIVEEKVNILGDSEYIYISNVYMSQMLTPQKAKNVTLWGTNYYAWYNDTGSDVVINYNFDNAWTGNNSASSFIMYAPTDLNNPLVGGEIASGKSGTTAWKNFKGSVTIPKDHYLFLFNQNSAETRINSLTIGNKISTAYGSLFTYTNTFNDELFVSIDGVSLGTLSDAYCYTYIVKNSTSINETSSEKGILNNSYDYLYGGTILKPNDTLMISSQANAYLSEISVVGKKTSVTKKINAGGVYGTLPTPTKDGYIFLGWNTKSDGSGTYVNEDIVCTIDVDHTLYAQWVSPQLVFKHWDQYGNIKEPYYPNGTEYINGYYGKGRTWLNTYETEVIIKGSVYVSTWDSDHYPSATVLNICPNNGALPSNYDAIHSIEFWDDYIWWYRINGVSNGGENDYIYDISGSGSTYYFTIVVPPNHHLYIYNSNGISSKYNMQIIGTR